jgi:hypothetical protein
MTSIPVNHEIELSIEPRDVFGNAARVDGDPVWALNDGADVDLIPTADPFKIIARTRSVIGAALVTVTVDADLGEGFRALTGTIALAIVPGEASTLAINAGAATPVAAPEPDPVDPATTEAPAVPEAVTEPVEAVVDPVVEAPVDAVTEPVVEAPAEPVTDTPAEGGETPAG